jgi:phosphohistidine phosphatase
MKTLYLLRHSDAQASGPGGDHTRDLTAKGHGNAQALAQYWTSQNYSVESVRCSSAVRAMNTFEPLRPVVGTSVIDVSRDYYDIDEDEILRYLRSNPAEHGSVLHIGHNPGIAYTAMGLLKDPPEGMLLGYPPCGLTVITFNVDNWSDINWKSGTCIDFWRP